MKNRGMENIKRKFCKEKKNDHVYKGIKVPKKILKNKNDKNNTYSIVKVNIFRKILTSILLHQTWWKGFFKT